MTNTDDDSIGDGLGGSYSTDDDSQLQADDTLDARGLDDTLDEGYIASDRPVAVNRFGTTAAEEAQGEDLERRLAEEEPDPNLVVDDPLARRPDFESRLVDEVDQVDLDDGYGDPEAEVGGPRAGRLVAPDEGAHEDEEKDMIASDVGIDGAGASAEEAAMHVIEPGDESDGQFEGE